ncbi:hypothetical protein PLESTB_000899400 [Pleodorina starrii]|uniref:Uncharacterized protein n=1 Tax=Pleodorina starrii TaxID=330485 RepID=A0A9W6BMH2_9CHLO|nr:hypothetical protein PLESTM_001564600 [Pleodorina starrii]GLC54723.1 hypothetical protein PLESTB_000899400 [Pleodorina starrii]GLC68326.1 hypothetical protein PLESTF_000679400 [Pleodorina starrii]
MAAAHEPKPRFHIAPPQGWINDPNGPLFYKGYYHMFYQYVETGCSWSWGLLWGHAVSRDLITWQHLPPALAPTFGGFDGDGCFSGCTTLDEDGVPTILYTGVRLRSSDACGPLPPPECDLGTACIETQCIAFGDPADPKLTYWTKEEVPFLSLPPPNMNLTAWRDPYVIGRPGQDGQDCWTVMVGAGVKENGGTALVYRSPSLRGGSWSYVGELCRGRGDTGVIWECPVMLRLPRLPAPPQTMAPSLARPQQVQSPLQAPPPAALLNLPALPSPASPRPPIKPRPASATEPLFHFEPNAAALAAAADAADRWREDQGHGAVWPPPPPATAAALLSPRRAMVQVLPQAPMSPLRSPARWNLPALTALPHAPSPPAPRPPSARPPGTPPLAALPASPIMAAAMAAGVPANLYPSSAAATTTAPAAAGVAAGSDRARRMSPASPRLLQLLPGSTGRPLPTHGSPASPRPFPPRSPSSAISALLAGSPDRAAAAPPTPRAATIAPPSPPKLKAAAAVTLPLPSAADGAVAAPPPSVPSWQCFQTFFCVCPDDCNSMAVYYLGSYDADGSAFNLDDALGPFPLDLGDIFYAPNTLMDPEGRAVLWGWLQEKPRKVDTYDYAGCLSMPRLLFLEVEEEQPGGGKAVSGAGGAPRSVHLVQRPPPEIAKLRVPGSEWLAAGLLLEPGSTLPVPLGCGQHLELELSLLQLPQPLEPLSEGEAGATTDQDSPGPSPGLGPRPRPSPGGPSPGPSPSPLSPSPSPTRVWPAAAGAAAAGAAVGAGMNRGAGGSRCSGVLLHNWRSGAEGAAALLYHWDSGVLEVVFEAMDPATLTFSLAAPGARRVGGRLQRPPAPGNPLALRVFLDHSCLEVFTGDGEVLTARVYRGSSPSAPGYPGGHHHHHHAHYYHHHHSAPPGGSAASTPPPPLYGVGGAAAAGVELVSFGCSTEFLSVGAYEVGTIWAEDV